MKNIKFIKMAGAGNDFMMIDAQKGLNYKKLAIKACDRSTGLGADGVIVFDKSKKADYKMRIFNADGSEAEMCGNGIRCLSSYIVKYKKPKKELFTIETLAGEILGSAKSEVAHVRLSEPTDFKPNIDVNIDGRDLHVKYLDTGVPHAVIFVEGLNQINVKVIGEKLRYHDAFKPRGTNVNFVEHVEDGLAAARTYERGVEDETKACGTGSVASAILAYFAQHPYDTNKKKARMKIRTTGGEILQVTFDIVDGHPTNVWLKGSAKFVAEGIYYF